MTTALDALLAPSVIPDIADAGYHEARRILEDHPDTRGMESGRITSLAQQIVDAVDETRWSRDEVSEQREEAYEAFVALAGRKGLPKYVRDAAPQWVIERLAEDGLTLGGVQ